MTEEIKEEVKSEEVTSEDVQDITQVPKYFLPDKAYIGLKWIGLAALPTFSWLYQVLGNVWSWPLTNEVSTTLGLIGTGIAILIGASQLSKKPE